MLPAYFQKNLVAASSNGLGSVSTAVPSVVTVNTSALDTQRRVVFYSTGDASSLTISFKGTRPGGGIVTESVVGSTGNGIQAATTQDFLTLTSASISSNANIPIIIGTNTQGGTPWWRIGTYVSPINVGFGITFTSTANSMAASLEYTFDEVTQGASNPFVNPPIAWISTLCSTVTGNTAGTHITPASYLRMTLTSSSSTAGSVNMTLIQAGIG